ncbi:hypothetical protein B4U80_13192 [Leptotrombidium deliense]|uniref:F-box/LRR-repeat protein 15/At3g58940/PEG3-like LRR domain-containing protein n=1 Tax=Leptotrombidium deliense TaxID=299467 RepID=A0A443SAP1_9ACAR|nr:hypothetical protein B4U80_13192 [Leptotrombidium deliense]
MTSEGKCPPRVFSLEEINLKEVLTVLPLNRKVSLRLRSDKYKNAVDYLLEFEVSIWIAEESKLIDKDKQIFGRVEVITVYFIKSQFPNLIHIGLGCSVDIKVFSDLIRGCTHLNMLTLDDHSFKDEHLNAIVEFGKLTNICLKRCKISERGLKTLITESSKLNALTLEQIDSIEGHCFHKLKHTFTALQVINCKRIDSKTWKAAVSGDTQNIDILLVHNCFLNTSDFETISKKMKKLTKLDLRFPLGTEKSLNFNIMSSFLGLKVLNISDDNKSPSFTAEHFSTIIRSCSQLNSIQLHFKQNADIKFKPDSFKNLSESCEKIAFLSFAGFGSIATQFKLCKQLQEFQFINMSSSDETFKNIIHQTLSLRKVKFVNCKNIGANTIGVICEIAEKTMTEWVYLRSLSSGIDKKFTNGFFKKRKLPKNLIIVYE